MGIGEKSFVALQKVGRSLMTPIAILPAAGLFLAFGAHLSNNLMTGVGAAIFGNLALLFAVGVAIGFAHEEGVSALAAVIALVVLNQTMGMSPFLPDGKTAAELISEGNRGYTRVMGIPTVETGVFGGILAGLIAAWCYNKFKNLELPAYLGFFAGKRFVPIVTAAIAFCVGLVMPVLWAPVQSGLTALSHAANGTNSFASTFTFGFFERALVPFGLHHIFYAPYWFEFGSYVTQAGDEIGKLVRGDNRIWFTMLADGSRILQEGGTLPADLATFSQAAGSVITNADGQEVIAAGYTGAGKFMTGKFPFMMFGLGGAALAMWQTARPERRPVVAGMVMSGALTAFLTGITEPIEFMFLFVAPILYYGIHVPLAALSFALMDLFNVRIGMSFSGGFIDYVLFGVIPGFKGFHNNWYMVLVIGVAYFFVYYLVFVSVIKLLKLKTPGREDDNEETLEMPIHDTTSGSVAVAKSESNASAQSDTLELSRKVVQALGGLDNVVAIDYCITRLRLQVQQTDVVDVNALKHLGAAGVLKVGNTGIQAVFGHKAQFIAGVMQDMKKA